MLGNLFGGQVFDVAKQERRTFLNRQQAEAIFEILLLVPAQHQAFRTAFGRDPKGFGEGFNFRKIDAAVTAKKIDGGVVGDAREPVGGFFGVLELIAALEGFPEPFVSPTTTDGESPGIVQSFLRRILSI